MLPASLGRTHRWFDAPAVALALVLPVLVAVPALAPLLDRPRNGRVTAVRALTVTAGVLLSIVSVVLAAAAIGLFLDGSAGAGGFAVFVVMVTLLCALLLFQATPARRPAGPPRQRHVRPWLRSRSRRLG